MDSTATWKIPFTNNIKVTDSTKLSFQLGGDCGTAFVGGVYSYTAGTGCTIDFSRNAYRRGVVAFGPRSFYTGPDSGLPQMIGMACNFNSGPHTASELQVGGTISSNSTFIFNTPLTSNLYGVYGFNRSPNSGNAYGGAIIRTFSYTNSSFTYNCYSTSSNVNFPNGNISFVVVQ
jgi:hypothetical protein